MRKFRIVLIIFAVIIIIGHFTFVEYLDLSWSENKDSYLGIISMILVIIGMIYSNLWENKNQAK